MLFTTLLIGCSKKSKYCTDITKKNLNKELLMTKKDNDDFKNSIKCWIHDNDYDQGDIKVRDHCHIFGKYRGSAHRDCNTNVKLNHKIPVIFRNLKKI